MLPRAPSPKSQCSGRVNWVWRLKHPHSLFAAGCALPAFRAGLKKRMRTFAAAAQTPARAKQSAKNNHRALKVASAFSLALLHLRSLARRARSHSRSGTCNRSRSKRDLTHAPALAFAAAGSAISLTLRHSHSQPQIARSHSRSCTCIRGRRKGDLTHAPAPAVAISLTLLHLQSRRQRTCSRDGSRQQPQAHSSSCTSSREGSSRKPTNKVVQHLQTIKKRRAAPAAHTSQIGAAAHTKLDIATSDPKKP